jgi:hypothetical protein
VCAARPAAAGTAQHTSATTPRKRLRDCTGRGGSDDTVSTRVCAASQSARTPGTLPTVVAAAALISHYDHTWCGRQQRVIGRLPARARRASRRRVCWRVLLRCPNSVTTPISCPGLCTTGCQGLRERDHAISAAALRAHERFCKGVSADRALGVRLPDPAL